MMKARTSLWASLAIAASIGLAGCGGSSDNDDPTPTGESSTPTKTAMSADIELSDAQSAALLAVLPDTGDSVELKGSGERAGVTFACTSADPCTITIENSAGTIVVTVHSMTSGTVSGTATGGEPEVSGAGAVALRGQLLDAADPSGESSPDNSGFTNNMPLAAAGFPHQPLDVDGVAPPFAELSNPKDFKSADAPVALQGWKGERWTKDGETIVRYTDQNVKTMTDGTFASRFEDNEAGGGKVITNTPTSGELDWENAVADGFPAAGRSQSYTDDVSITGKYAGVDGKFTCSTPGTGCGLQRSDKGKLSSTTSAGNNIWTFTADDENAAVEYKTQDADYLAFGWWRDTSTGGTTIEDFKVLYSGRLSRVAIANSLTGKATYNGHAAGNYVKGSTGGEFVADAKIEIDFDVAGAPGSLDGSIGNFRDSSGESLGEWEVIAKDSAIITTENTAGGDSSPVAFTGGADKKNWATAASGINYYGGTGSQLPTGVAGWFHATTNDAGEDELNDPDSAEAWADDDVAVAGAFAATRHNRPDVAAE